MMAFSRNSNVHARLLYVGHGTGALANNAVCRWDGGFPPHVSFLACIERDTHSVSAICYPIQGMYTSNLRYSTQPPAGTVTSWNTYVIPRCIHIYGTFCELQGYFSMVCTSTVLLRASVPDPVPPIEARSFFSAGIDLISDLYFFFLSMSSAACIATLAWSCNKLPLKNSFILPFSVQVTHLPTHAPPSDRSHLIFICVLDRAITYIEFNAKQKDYFFYWFLLSVVQRI